MEKNEKFGEQPDHLAHLNGGHTDNSTDESLAARLSTADRSAAVELVDKFYEQIYLFMRRLGHSPQTSEDLTQEVFFQAWRQIGQLRNSKALAGWLYRIASNVSNWYRRRHKNMESSASEKMEILSAGQTTEDNAEEIRALRAAIEGLPARFKQVIILHYMQRLTIEETAEAVGVRAGTIKSRLNRALKVLRKKLPQ